MPNRIGTTGTARSRCCLLGATEDDQRQFGDALTHLKAAAKRLPELADYVAYLSAVAEAGLRQFNETETALQPVWQVDTRVAAGDESGRCCRLNRICKAAIRRAPSRWSSTYGGLIRAASRIAARACLEAQIWECE